MSESKGYVEQGCCGGNTSAGRAGGSEDACAACGCEFRGGSRALAYRLIAGLILLYVVTLGSGLLLGMAIARSTGYSPSQHAPPCPGFLSNTIIAASEISSRSDASLPVSSIMSLSDPSLRDSIKHDLTTTFARMRAGSSNATGSVSPRGNYPPTIPDCTPNGNICRLTVTTWDSPGHSTAVLGAFDAECNLIGYLDNAPMYSWVNFDSQLPDVIVTLVSDINWVYFKYDGTAYGNQLSFVDYWEEANPWYGNLAYEIAPFHCWR